MTDLQVLQEMQRRLYATKWWMSKDARMSLKTHVGLCYLLNSIVGKLCSWSNSDQYSRIFFLLKTIAPKFRADLNNNYWWREGRIRPRRKTVDAAIQTIINILP